MSSGGWGPGSVEGIAHRPAGVRSPLGAVTVVPPGGWSLVDNKRNTHTHTSYRGPSLPTKVNTERLAQRETFLHRLGSKLNRTVSNYCGNPIIRSAKTRDFCAEPGFFANGSHSHQKRSQKRKLTIFGNTKQVIQDYDTVFDNSILFRKHDLLRITYFRIPGVPGVPGLHFVPWHRGSWCLGASDPVTGAAACGRV